MTRPCAIALALLVLTVGPTRAADPLPSPGRSEFILPTGGPPLPGFPPLRFKRGDDPSWADPKLDDSDWERRRHIDGLPAHTGIYWVRLTLRQPAAPWRLRDGLSIAAVASYDLFLDGHLIASNGVVGADRESEVPGRLDSIVRIPDALLTPGEHVLALRMSAWRSGFSTETYRLNFAVGGYRALIERRVELGAVAVVVIGAGLAVAVVLTLLWCLVERRRELLLLAAAALVAALMQGLQAWRWLGEYPFDWHRPRLQAIALSVAVFGLLVVAALQAFLELRRRALLLACLGVAMAGIWLSARGWYQLVSFQLFVSALIFALFIALWATIRRRTGAGYALTGVLASLAVISADPDEILEKSFSLSAGAPILGCVAAVSVRLREERKAARQVQLTAARLEIELLRKQIQPHFVMNTLTTVQEVIEQDPKSAVALIGALAEEFRVLARISNLRSIPLAEEIDLCRTHLRIMRLRKDVDYSLEIRSAPPDLDVPPALLLTLVENGLTHAAPRGTAVRFTVEVVQVAPGSVRIAVTAPAGESSHEATTGGTGLRYVRARLEESFPGRWSLRAGPVDGGWETLIEIVEDRSR